MYTQRVFGTVKCVFFMEMSFFQGIPNRRFHCVCMYAYTQYVSQLYLLHSLLHCSALQATIHSQKMMGFASELHCTHVTM